MLTSFVKAPFSNFKIENVYDTLLLADSALFFPFFKKFNNDLKNKFSNQGPCFAKQLYFTLPRHNHKIALI